MRYRFFDPLAPTTVYQRHLPHWQQENALYFITFRTADSLPHHVRATWIDDRDRWLRSRGVDVAAPGWRRRLDSLSSQDRRTYAATFGRFWQRQLDACHGSCPLRSDELRMIVSKSLLHFDGQRYSIVAFVIMPNHVHVLAGVRGRGALPGICSGWKKHSATLINRRLGRRGRFWQSESYDHLVRSPDNLLHLRDYILANPRRAGLPATDYTIYLGSPSLMSPVNDPLTE
jgi:REP element-mobilizing transposase RayT